MNALNWSKMPGLLLAVVLHGFGIFFLIKATNMDCNKIGRVAAMQRQLEGPEFRYDPQIREREVQCNQSMSVNIWASLAFWLISLAGVVHTTIQVKQGDKQGASPSTKPQTAEAKIAEPDIGLFHSIKDGLAELETCLKRQPVGTGTGMSLQLHQHNIKMLQSQTQQTSQILMNSHSLLQKGLARVQSLVSLCRESANYTASNRIEWKKNNLSGILTQIRQNHDQLLDRSKNMASMHSSTMRLLHEAILSEKIIHQKVSRIEEKLKEVQNGSYSVHKTIEKLIDTIGESREDVQSASKLVNSYKQKSENMGAIVSRIDELAEKVNRYLLSSSMDYVQVDDSNQDYYEGVHDFRSMSVDFHNHSMQFKEYVEMGQPELDKAQHFLLEAAQKSEHAYISVKRIEEAYRNDVAAAKYAISDLSLLNGEVHIHMNKLNETRDLGDDTSRVSHEVMVLLDNVNAMHRRFNEESGLITLQCEKLSNLLTKQHIELGHCEKILTESTQSIASAIRHANETKQNAASWIAGPSPALLDSGDYKGDKTSDAQPVEEIIVHKLEDFKKMFARLEANLERRESDVKVNHRLQKVTLASVSR